MRLKMARYGFCAGISFLALVLILQWLAEEETAAVRTPASENAITEQMWQVLAEARRILEESA